jgi:hypothetical protein
MKLPAFQFYTGDWLKDPALSMCTPATRGIWIDLLCAMHEADQSGTISGTAEQLARIARCSPVDLDHAIADLQTTGAAVVTKRVGVVTVSNRRMQAAYVARLSARLRKRKERCHNDVTSPSSSSSSTSVNPQPPEGAADGGEMVVTNRRRMTKAERKAHDLDAEYAAAKAARERISS